MNRSVLPLTCVLSRMLPAVSVCTAWAESAEAMKPGDLLYNGIRLPDQWPRLAPA